MRVLVLANGTPSPAVTAELLAGADAVVAADGGAAAALAAGRVPDVVVGDLDSVTPDNLARARAGAATIVRHPAAKDATDLALALAQAERMGATEVIVVGASGGRMDHTLGGILHALSGWIAPPVIVAGDGWRATAVLPTRPLFLGESARGRAAWAMSAAVGDTLSLIPVCSAAGVVTSGLAYPLSGESLSLGTTRGVSNVVRTLPATVTVAEGIVLCVVLEAEEVGRT